MMELAMRSILATAFLSLITLVSFPQAERDPKFIDFLVEGVRLGDSESHVIEKLGKPVRRTVERVGYCSTTQIVKLAYKGLEFYLDRDLEDELFVLEIIVISPKIAIEPAVGIGAEWSAVRKKFGEPFYESESEQTLGFLTRDNDNATFQFRKRKLSKIRLWINPC